MKQSATIGVERTLTERREVPLILTLSVLRYRSTFRPMEQRSDKIVGRFKINSNPNDNCQSAGQSAL